MKCLPRGITLLSEFSLWFIPLHLCPGGLGMKERGDWAWVSRRAAAPLAFLLPLLLLLPAPAFPFDQNGCTSGACADCHLLSTEEAASLLGGRADRVLSVAPSEVPGMWALTVEKGGRRSLVLLSYSRRHLFSSPPVALSSTPSPRPEPHVDPARIPFAEAGEVVGNRHGSRQVAVFTATDCPACARLAPEMKKAAAADPELGFFLLPMKEHAPLAAELGIRRTPALVFPDGGVTPGFHTAEAILGRLKVTR